MNSLQQELINDLSEKLDGALNECAAWKTNYGLANKEIENLKNGIKDIDFALSTMESYMHGDEGEKITSIRLHLQSLLKNNKP